MSKTRGYLESIEIPQLKAALRSAIEVIEAVSPDATILPRLKALVAGEGQCI